MATVYLAEDVRHHRKVAVKVLHAEFSAALGTERFLKEIELTAGLQHPHILPLFDSGAVDGIAYYVMPYVDGETLRARLARERQLPVEEALRIARQVADALAYAHERGVIHRDIKPENILLQGGHALVADFGIALAVEQAGERMTQTGLSLGTPQYMAPEQAAGERSVDGRADVYALGAVTYEMLAGEPPFTGPTAQAIVARLMTERPPGIIARRGTVPPHVENAVLIALERLPADRFASAAEFSAALMAPGKVATRRGRAIRHPRTSRWPLVALGVVALGATVVAAWALSHRAASPDRASGPVYQASIVLPDSTPLAFIGSGPLGVGTPALAVSPDGATLVFVGQSGGTTRLYVRPLSGSTIAALPGTEGAYAPFFSPDGQSVAFFAGGTLKRTSLAGGATVALADLVLPYGGAWLADGRIVVLAQEGHMLVAVPSAGGAPTPIGARGVPVRMVFPQPLPGDSAVLLSTVDAHLAVVSTRTGRTMLLGPDGPVAADLAMPGARLFAGTNPRFVSSGHLLYQSLDGAVMAVPFDDRAARALGPPVPVLADVRVESVWGIGQLATTRDGALIYAPGENGRLTTLVWRDAAGRQDTLSAFGRADYGELDLSADGTRLVVRICTSQGTCAPHALRLREGVRVVLPSAPGFFDSSVGWVAMGDQIFDSRPMKARDTSMIETRLYSPETPERVERLAGVVVRDVARDGGVLYERGGSLHVAPNMDEVRSATPHAGFRLREADAWGHQLRQGGEWVAYTARSEQAGEYVVFMARTRPPFDHWRASPRGGEEPVWSPAGELVYREGNRWMSVSPPKAAGAGPGPAKFLFTGPYLNVLGRSHDIAPDGRHLLIAGPTQLTTTTLTLVTNWVSR